MDVNGRFLFGSGHTIVFATDHRINISTVAKSTGAQIFHPCTKPSSRNEREMVSKAHYVHCTEIA